MAHNPTTLGKIDNEIKIGNWVAATAPPAEWSDWIEKVGDLYHSITPNEPGVTLFESEIDENNIALIVGRFDNADLDLYIYVGNPEASGVEYLKKWTGFNGLDTQATGSCGISGLRAILKSLPGIIQWTRGLKKIKRITACPSDEKRARAYRVLAQLGFRWDAKEEEYIFEC